MNPAISLIISILSIVISAIAIIVAIWTHSRSHKLQKRIVNLEETRERDRLNTKQKANLTAQIKREKTVRGIEVNNAEFLVIENKGFAEARNITVKLDKKPLLEHKVTADRKEVKIIGPQSQIQYRLLFTMQVYPPFEIDITWEDDSREPGKYRSTLA